MMKNNVRASPATNNARSSPAKTQKKEYQGKFNGARSNTKDQTTVAINAAIA